MNLMTGQGKPKENITKLTDVTVSYCLKLTLELGSDL